MSTYSVVRFFRDLDEKPVIRSGLTLEEAAFHCQSDEASSSTATSKEAVERTAQCGPWFDGFRREGVPEEEA